MTVIQVEPDAQQKLKILGSEAADEVTDLPPAQRNPQATSQPIDLVYTAKREGGGTTRLFKVLQTNACKYSCL